jgi:hypothetical protein
MLSRQDEKIANAARKKKEVVDANLSKQKKFTAFMAKGWADREKRHAELVADWGEDAVVKLRAKRAAETRPMAKVQLFFPDKEKTSDRRRERLREHLRVRAETRKSSKLAKETAAADAAAEAVRKADAAADAKRVRMEAAAAKAALKEATRLREEEKRRGYAAARIAKKATVTATATA